MINMAIGLPSAAWGASMRRNYLPLIELCNMRQDPGWTQSQKRYISLHFVTSVATLTANHFILLNLVFWGCGDAFIPSPS
jgi:hypothetical protein